MGEENEAKNNLNFLNQFVEFSAELLSLLGKRQFRDSLFGVSVKINTKHDLMKILLNQEESSKVP